MEIACVILFFMLRETFIATFDWKEIKLSPPSQLSLKWSWFKHFLLCWLKEQITHYKNFFEKKKRFYQNEIFSEFFWCLTSFGTLNSADHEIDRLICDVTTKEFKKWKLELCVCLSLSWGRQCWQCCCNFDASYWHALPFNSCIRTPHLFTCIWSHVFLNFSSSIYVTVPLFLRGFREKAKTLDNWE